MAEKDSKKRIISKSESIRERAEKAGNARPRSRRIRSTATTISKPFKTAVRIGRKEVYLPLPDNRTGRFLNKRRYLFPRFLINAWREVRQVSWPSRKETSKLTVAVFMFAIIFGVIITATDYGLDKIVKQVYLK